MSLNEVYEATARAFRCCKENKSYSSLQNWMHFLHFCKGLHLNAKAIAAAQMTWGETLTWQCIALPSSLQMHYPGIVFKTS